MNKNNYKECYRVSDEDNLFLQYYDIAYVKGTNTPSDDNRQERIGYKYTNNNDWSYEYNNNEQHYYVVVY